MKKKSIINKNRFNNAFLLIKQCRFRILFHKLKKTLLDFLTHSKINRANLVSWIHENVQEHFKNSKKIPVDEIDIIIPVYNGYEYFDGLFRTLPKTEIPFRLLIIDDKSTDERVASFLDKIEQHFENAVLLSNNENLGFIKSVNRALLLARNHTVLINTDVELPEKWLERLIMPFYTDPLIASATPFTNSGTICSFPKINEDNDLPAGLTLNEIDAAFQTVKPIYYSVPSGVGFCMAMNINVIKKIGVFDDRTFGRGYGEENDWCQRAIKAGYKNVIVENLFVWHKHGGSFSNAEKIDLLKRNLDLLGKKHPKYHVDVIKTFERKPHYEQRAYLLMILRQNLAGKIICYFDHNLGGGANIYLDRVISHRNSESIYLIRYDHEEGEYYLNLYLGEYTGEFKFETIDEIQVFINCAGIKEIIINNLVSYPDIFNTMKIILKLKEENNIKLRMLIHDYFPVCPVYYLLDHNNEYCGFSEFKNCSSCLRKNGNVKKVYYHNEEISVWRSKWSVFIKECASIVVFSHNSKNIMETIFGALPQIEVIPHTIDYIKPVLKTKKNADTLNIGLLGNINLQKGSAVIQNMLDIIDKSNIYLIHFGTSGPSIKNSNFIQLGKYRQEDLSDLTLEYDIDIFFVSSIWPETFSYTTQEVIEMGMPIACFDLGAPAERVKEYDKGIIIPEITALCALETMIKWHENQGGKYFRSIENSN